MKIFLSKINESWIVDRLRKEWYENNRAISTNSLRNAKIIWIISPWTWKKIPKRHLISKIVICTIHHIDFEKFNQEVESDFYERDRYVNVYHVFSDKSKQQLQKLTNKKIRKIPYWVNQNIWFPISEKNEIRKEFSFELDDYLIGSFQRDTEGSDLVTPKLIKGPDIFLELVTKLHKENNSLKVVLTGKRRNYLINNLNDRGIPIAYFEMVDFKTMNKLYNILDLYLVTSRVEGGPQAILECGLAKVPLISTDVGLASEMLHTESIFKLDSFSKAKPNVDYAYNNAIKYKIPDGMKPYINLFKEYDEN